jgi:hypothetical protein
MVSLAITDPEASNFTSAAQSPGLQYARPASQRLPDASNAMALVRCSPGVLQASMPFALNTTSPPLAMQATRSSAAATRREQPPASIATLHCGAPEAS